MDKLKNYLIQRGLEPRTLGVSDYDMDAPLKAIRRLMLESNGLITVALRRTIVSTGKSRPDPDVPEAEESDINDQWLTSPYCQVEPAMAYQLGLPVLILRERGVLAEGLLEKGVIGTYMPEFRADGDADDFLDSAEWNALVGKWEGFVRAVVERKGNPPQLY